MLPGPAVPGCCLVSFHFLWAILCPQAVDRNSENGCMMSNQEHFSRVMGDAADPDGPQGKFYLYTNEKTPMAKDTPQESTSCQWIDFT